jgi:hypothetical protein
MSDDPTKNLDDNSKLDELLSIVRGLSSKVGSMDSRLSSLEQKVDERLYDTRPLWEGVQVQLVELREGQEKIALEVRAMRTAFGRSYADLLTTQEEHEERLGKLEDKRQ